QTVIGNGSAGYAGDGLPGRGVTITASVAPGGPTYLPITIGVDVEQSTWQVSPASSNTAGPNFPFTVQQTSAAGSALRMNSTTTFSLNTTVANVLSLPTTLTIPNNGTSVSPTTFAISSISRSNNVVTVTATQTVAGTLTTGGIVGISGFSGANASFNG